MKKFCLFFAILIVLGMVGCGSKNQYQITDLSLEKSDLDHNTRFDNLKIFYTINNNAELTLSAKISISLNTSCFQSISDRELAVIPPKQNIRTYSTLSVSSSSTIPLSCFGKSYPITLNLLDINGKLLDSKSVKVGIV